MPLDAPDHLSNLVPSTFHCQRSGFHIRRVRNPVAQSNVSSGLGLDFDQSTTLFICRFDCIDLPQKYRRPVRNQVRASLSSLAEPKENGPAHKGPARSRLEEKGSL
jgi:hypothetical protein